MPASIFSVCVLPAPDGPNSTSRPASLAEAHVELEAGGLVPQLLAQGHVPDHRPALTTCGATRPGTSRPADSSTAMQTSEVTATRKLAMSSCPACTAS